MQIRYAIAWAMVAIQSTDASNSTSKGDLNGWYPCSEYTFSDEGSSTGQVAQCAVYSAPLCYPGICETPPGVNSEVDVFVKRLPATAADPATTTNVWLLQGGPGASSTDLEISMATLHSELEGTVNVYTMDHRGTGRSTKPDCVAAQVTTTGSPWDLQIKYGDLASFSVTTAATDLATFISRFTNGAGTIVYGVSYGTMFAERLMHLAPPQVTGYVLDGIATTSGAPEFFYASKWDNNFGEVGDAFLALGESDSNCKPHFDSNGLNNTLQGVLEQFDHDPNSTCAALVNSTVETGESPSANLRIALESTEAMKPKSRQQHQIENKSTTYETHYTQALENFFANQWGKLKLVALDPLKHLAKSQTAIQYNFSSDHASLTSPMRTTIPNQASVLLLSGKLDPQTPNKYAEYLLNALRGEKKELIAFEYATHGTVMTTPMVADNPWSETCGMKVLASYVRVGGDLERLDKSCVAEMPAFNLTTPDYYLYSYFGTDVADDGY
ncbi:hypothetical protein PPTG_24260 [Phytophthora nicotianae INRA-310]|uniref:AB hydrolase-1 domain-containing protein n=1 Tax=Phytophthora nicotianae (strain INRA-310) TaxID=761204 RepID=W2PJJ4_PHYN3|nr:hypothetical protein PPTG_24260 [Phytophthora nicotianae INRA-310]ETN00404.1 hypothetical protein PPTG_24260 [Phytophthora nicotianae INRA-310]